MTEQLQKCARADTCTSYDDGCRGWAVGPGCFVNPEPPEPIDTDAIRHAVEWCDVVMRKDIILGMCGAIERLRERLEAAEGHVTRLNQQLGVVVEQRSDTSETLRLVRLAYAETIIEADGLRRERDDLRQQLAGDTADDGPARDPVVACQESEGCTNIRCQSNGPHTPGSHEYCGRTEFCGRVGHGVICVEVGGGMSKPTKTQIQAELKCACGKVSNRTFDEVSQMVQTACNDFRLEYIERLNIAAALLWSQGFEADQAKEAAKRLIRAVGE